MDVHQSCWRHYRHPQHGRKKSLTSRDTRKQFRRGSQALSHGPHAEPDISQSQGRSSSRRWRLRLRLALVGEENRIGHRTMLCHLDGNDRRLCRSYSSSKSKGGEPSSPRLVSIRDYAEHECEREHNEGRKANNIGGRRGRIGKNQCPVEVVLRC